MALPFRHMTVRYWMALSILSASIAVQASTYSVEDVPFEDHETVAGQRLVLNGASSSNILSAKATTVGFYVRQKHTVVDDLLRQGGAKRIRLVPLRDISSKDLGSVLMDRIRQNATAEEKAANILQIVQVGQNFAALPQLSRGDVATIDWIPERGHTEFRVNGKLIGEPVAGDAFYPMFMKVWVGPRTRPGTRNNLLGIGEPLTARQP